MTQRNDKLDFIKGLLIIGVVYGHILNAVRMDTNTSFWIVRLIRTFDMPMFMLIGGYFLSKSILKYEPVKYALNKVTNLIAPLIIWCVLMNLTRMILTGQFDIVQTVKFILSYWFIWAIFICSIVYIGLSLIKCKILRLVCVIAIGIIWHVIPPQYTFNLSYVYVFFSIGFYLDSIWDILPKKFIKVGNIIFIIVFIVLMCFWNTDYTIWNTSGYLLEDTAHRIAIAVYRFLIGLTGIITAYTVYGFLYSACKKDNIISRIGKTSLMNYIIHPFIISIVFNPIIRLLIEKLGYNVFTYNVLVSELIFAPIVAFVISFLIEFAITLIKRIPYVGKYAFGFNICNARTENTKNEKI